MPAKKKKLPKKKGIRTSRKTVSKPLVLTKDGIHYFTLYPDERIESSPEIADCYKRAISGFKDPKGGTEDLNDRIRLMEALLGLGQYHASKTLKDTFKQDPIALLDELAEVLGSRILVNSKREEVPVSGDEESVCLDGSRKTQWRKKKVLGESQSLRDLILSAFDGLKGYLMNKERDARVKHKKPNIIWAIHHEAKNIVRTHKRLPFKREIRKTLEADGWSLKGKGAWIDKFSSAGLAGLDEWDPKYDPKKNREARNYQPIPPMSKLESQSEIESRFLEIKGEYNPPDPLSIPSEPHKD
jgi:hypothetical protein